MNNTKKHEPHSPETRAKISASLMGNKNMLGHKFSAEHRAHMAATQIGKTHTPETRAKLRAIKTGTHHSEETKKKLSMLKGPLANNWKGGKYPDSYGYVRIRKPDHPYTSGGYVFEHRLVMEEFLARFLFPTEVVHHINGNPADNRIENLILFSNNTEHKRAHPRERDQFGRFLDGRKSNVHIKEDREFHAQ